MATTHDVDNYTIKTSTDNGDEFAFEVRNNKGQILAKGAKWEGHRGEDAAVRNATRFIRKRQADIRAERAELEQQILELANIAEDERTDEQQEIVAELLEKIDEIDAELGEREDEETDES